MQRTNSRRAEGENSLRRLRLQAGFLSDSTLGIQQEEDLAQHEFRMRQDLPAWGLPNLKQI
jgi:hypothetical protein